MPSTAPPFLNLPPELRNRIIDYAGSLKILKCKHCYNTLRGDEADHHINAHCVATNPTSSTYDINITSSRQATNTHSGKESHWPFIAPEIITVTFYKDVLYQPALTKVSRQLRQETIPIFYGSNSFHFHVLVMGAVNTNCLTWLSAIGREKAAMIRLMTILWGGGPEKTDKWRIKANKYADKAMRLGVDVVGMMHVQSSLY